MLYLLLFLLLTTNHKSMGFAPAALSWHGLARTFSDRHFFQAKADSDDRYNDDNTEDDDETKVRVPKRGFARRSRFDDVEEQASSSRESGRYYGSRDYYYDEKEESDEEEDFEFSEGDGFLDDEDEDQYDLLSDVVIPNPLLDSIDPDGAADRFPELARDPRFWFDIVLFISILNFLSDLGPRNPSYFPWIDIPWQSM